mmetsp:Transcript_6131/g.7933  ORF Transcript_6131/g.7933 Transcript_6131/m.7933 type:complete len:154 (-) Transcript_6131:118-579(-)
MTSTAGQAKAQALNAKLEVAARQVLDDVDRVHMRKNARGAYACVVACYDKAGSTGPPEILEQCAQNCQIPHQQANSYMQQEISQFQNRLNRSMQECQDKTRDMMKPGYENDARKMQQVEDAMISCIAGTVDTHIGMLKPMKERILEQLKLINK